MRSAFVAEGCVAVTLNADEQITLKTPSDAEFDVAAKTWGFYATPSFRGRLARFGLRPGLVGGENGAHYAVIVERGHEDQFDAWLEKTNRKVLTWLDDEKLSFS